MTTAQQRLHHALDALDRTARPGPRVDGCTHCFTPAQLGALAGPPALLPNGLLHSAAAKHPTHWGDFPTLYRRLAPRVLRQLTTGRLDLDGSLVGARLYAANWREWPSADLVQAVLDAWWDTTLDHYPARPSAPETFETLTAASGSPTPWLHTWSATPTPAADTHLADTLTTWLSDGELPDLRLGFYSDLPVGPELLAWLLTLPPSRIRDDQRQLLEPTPSH
ncbi:hypothetical protein AB0K51_26525 [Kitasatospora sp. NPDC049285]|uniref:hypothetical protein n=1 Tax=Kitasatospora sp. NPDC049285 TaxID=3157096 RepID=UPI0034446195